MRIEHRGQPGKAPDGRDIPLSEPVVIELRERPAHIPPPAPCEHCPDPEDENADHLAGSEEAEVISRREARHEAKTRIAAQLRDNPTTTYDTASPALRADVRRHFGSWNAAVRAAGKRGAA